MKRVTFLGPILALRDVRSFESQQDKPKLYGESDDVSTDGQVTPAPNQSKHGQPEDDKAIVTFEQSRLDHCIRLFTEENSRREGFDKTGQYYLAFITAFLGALLFKIDFLQTLKQLLAKSPVPVALVWIVYLSITIMLLSIFLALVCVLECIRVRRYHREFPDNPAFRLFDRDSTYSGGEDKAAFLRTTAMTYVAAIEANFDITERKGQWIVRASLFMLVSVLSLFMLLAATTYLVVH